LAAAAVGAYIGAAYWLTFSTSFANPAVTIGRDFSDTFAGIAPASVPPFVAAQLVGGTLGLALVLALYPDTTRRDAAAEYAVAAHLGTDRRVELEETSCPTSSPSAAVTSASAPPCAPVNSTPRSTSDRRRRRRLPELLHLRHPLLRLRRGHALAQPDANAARWSSTST
jgi:hypothetical protein